MVMVADRVGVGARACCLDKEDTRVEGKKLGRRGSRGGVVPGMALVETTASGERWDGRRSLEGRIRCGGWRFVE